MTTFSPLPYALAISNPPSQPMHYHRSQLCRYRSKVCNKLRAHKRDGSLHRYCEEHRQRANTNQKRWAKRRMQTLEAGEFNAHQLAYGDDVAYQLLSQPVSDYTLSLSPIDVDATTVDAPFEQWQGLSLLEFDKDMLRAVLGLDEPLEQADAFTYAL